MPFSKNGEFRMILVLYVCGNSKTLHLKPCEQPITYSLVVLYIPNHNTLQTGHS